MFTQNAKENKSLEKITNGIFDILLQVYFLH